MGGKLAPAALAALAAACFVSAPAARADTSVTCGGLQAALNAANDGDTITLADGEHCSANFTLPAKPAPFSITLEGGVNARFDHPVAGGRILTGSATGSNVVNITIRNLDFNGGSAPPSQNGGALLLSGNVGVTLDHDRFFGNSAPSRGGAVAILSSNSTRPTVVSTSMFGDSLPGRGNTAGDGGGALYIDNSSPSSPSVQLTVNRFRGNSAGGPGGGMRLVNQSPGKTMTLTGNAFLDNEAVGFGGGAYIQGYGLALAGNFFLNNVLDNTTAGSAAFGGGAFVQAADKGQTASQSDNDFGANEVKRGTQSTFDAGGAGEWIAGYELTSAGDTFTGNSLPAPAGFGHDAEGAGLGVEGCQFGAVTTPVKLENAVFAGNKIAAGGSGAGVYAGGCAAGPVDLALLDSTIAGNDPGGTALTGGLHGGPDDTLTLRNSIVAGNSGVDLSGFAPDPAVTYSDACGPGVLPGAGNICADPALESPRLGGVRETTTSPTVDHGSSGQVPADLATDFEGDARIAGPSVDMGADEFTAPTVQTNGTRAVRSFRATLKGTVNPNTIPTLYQFEYGETNAYGERTKRRQLPAGNAVVLVAAKVTGLRPSHRYHYRLIAENSGGTAFGGDRSFKTDPDPFRLGMPDQTANVRRGRARVLVICPPKTPGGCTGTLTLRREAATTKLGLARFSLTAGRRKRVQVKLSKKGRRALHHLRELDATAVATAHDAFVTRTSRAEIRLRPAR